MDRFRRLIADFGLTPVVACEVEFYLPNALDEGAALAVIDARAEGAWPAQKERGAGQYEIALRHHADPVRMAEDTRRLKRLLEAELAADFRAKPFADQPGSALHVHVSLHDATGRNVFTRDSDAWDAPYSEPLLHAIGGLLADMPERMPVFAPNPESWARFQPGQHAPTTASWGPNNRTVAIRLPQKPLRDKHLEHRVAGADADPEAVIAAILAGVHRGLRERIVPPAPIHGDASDPQYGAPPLVGR